MVCFITASDKHCLLQERPHLAVQWLCWGAAVQSSAGGTEWKQRCFAAAELQSVCCSPRAASASFGFLQEMNKSLNFFFFFFSFNKVRVRRLYTHICF